MLPQLYSVQFNKSCKGELKDPIFTSLLVGHVEEVIMHWPSVIPRVIIIWILANGILELDVWYDFIIHQKYLLVGHTQIEID
ncbi:hypothetical protein PR048_020862 [Dryococelus australis]|uniref:Uncharacterized protein n=1 Tax=Dryococelus australis TaxID=614101 RepID=A0ABQ9GWL4_9NEOP|nr:hypothetical protein PR048_020862 [Dryococelus australis]